MFFRACSLQNEAGDPPFFFTFPTLLTHHLSMVKFSEKKINVRKFSRERPYVCNGDHKPFRMALVSSFCIIRHRSTLLHPRWDTSPSEFYPAGLPSGTLLYTRKRKALCEYRTEQYPGQRNWDISAQINPAYSALL